MLLTVKKESDSKSMKACNVAGVNQEENQVSAVCRGHLIKAVSLSPHIMITMKVTRGSNQGLTFL